jgi:hypothetical protein
MKKTILFAMIASVVLVLSGCGGGGGGNSDDNKTQPTPSGISAKEFKIIVCTEKNKDDEACAQAKEFDLMKNNVVVLKTPDDIGANLFNTYGGNRFLVVAKSEKSISILNALAQAMMENSKEPIDYKEAQRMLKEDFKLTGTPAQNKALLAVYNYNLELLGEEGVPLPLAVDADIKAMAEELVNLTVKEEPVNWSGLGADTGADCVRHEYGTCVEWVGAGSVFPTDKDVLMEKLRLDKYEAGRIAFDIREKSDKPNALDAVFKELSCKDTEDKQIYMYGVYDGFDATNSEPANPSAALTNLFSTNISLDGYDHTVVQTNGSYFYGFLETLSGLPSNLTQGLFAIGLKEKGYTPEGHDPVFFDKYVIGPMGAVATLSAAQANIHDGNVSTLRNTWDAPATDVYTRDLSMIMTNSQQSLLSTLQTGQTLDTYIFATTNVDFIAVAACVPKSKPTEPETPVKDIPVKIECNTEKGEHLVTVWGGVSDDFAPGTDAVTASSAVISAVGASIKYDEPVKKLGTFADTLAHPNAQVTQMQLLVNTRPSASGSANDRILVGDISTLQAASPSLTGGTLTPNGGTAILLYGGETTYNNSGVAVGNLLSLLNGGSDLDIVVSDQTEVDVARLSMCIVEKEQDPCPDADGDGVCDDVDCAPEDPTVWEGCDDANDSDVPPETCNQKLSIDLSQANTWIDSNNNAPTVHNEFITYPPNPNLAGKIWDGDLTWFNFGSQSGAIHELSMDFCACGTADIIISEFKSDNYGKMYLDTDPTPSSYTNPSYIVSRSAYSQTTMASWGTSESGSLYVPYAGTATDHTLNMTVKNAGGPSGGAVNGTLDFIGHLGACTPEDNVTVPTEDNDTVVVHPDNNWTVVTATGSVAVIIDITWNPIPDTPVSEGNGTVVIGIAGPIIATNPAGKPFVDHDPSVVVDLGEIEHVGLDDAVLVLIDHLIDPPQYERDPDTQIVTDHEQELMWQDDEEAANTTKKWLTSANYNAPYTDTSGDTAITYCTNLNLGGYVDWRLPSKSELQSIVDYSVTNPAMDTSVFIHATSHNYWSSTTDLSDAARVGIVRFFGGIAADRYKGNTFNVRCVRDGQ